MVLLWGMNGAFMRMLSSPNGFSEGFGMFEWERRPANAGNLQMSPMKNEYLNLN